MIVRRGYNGLGFILTAIFFLPFTYVLVLNFGFPLKVYEVVISLFLIVIIARGLVSGKITFKFHKYYYPIFLFAFVVLITGLPNLVFILDKFDHFPEWAVGRDRPYVSFFLEFIYLILFNIFFSILVANRIVDEENFYKVLRVICISSIVVSIYGLYEGVGAKFNIPIHRLPSPDDRRAIMGFYGGMPRISSTFREPSYFAGYLVSLIPITLSQLLIDKNYRQISTFLLFASLFFQSICFLLTFSTGGWLSLVVGMLFFLLLYFRMKKAFVAFVLIPFLIILFIFISQPIFKSEIFRLLIYNKLFSQEMGPEAYSRIDRTRNFVNGLRLFSRYPVFGVGLSNYGLLVANLLSEEVGARQITNNIYIKMLAETGIIGFSFFIMFLSKIFVDLLRSFKETKDRAERMNLAGLLSSFAAILATYNAFPTFAVSFHWVTFGIFIGYLSLIKSKKGGEYCR
jgi:O-antigen ligase